MMNQVCFSGSFLYKMAQKNGAKFSKDVIEAVKQDALTVQDPENAEGPVVVLPFGSASEAYVPIVNVWDLIVLTGEEARQFIAAEAQGTHALNVLVQSEPKEIDGKPFLNIRG